MNKFNNFKWFVILLAGTVIFNGCNQKNKVNMSAPVAKKIEKVFEEHGNKRIDNYYWLNERENPEVINYLNAENDYYYSMTGHTKKFQEDLFAEMKSRIKEDDASVPYKKNGYFYITRYTVKKHKDYSPFISIIVPAFNEGITLKNSIESLLNLDYQNYEVIIVTSDEYLLSRPPVSRVVMTK